MKTIAEGILTLVALCLAGCASPVKVDFDTNTDFTPYRTYRWYGGDVHPHDALASDPLAKKRVISAVDAVLQEKGFVPNNGLSSDFIVFVHGTVQQQVQIHETGGAYRNYRGFGMGASSIAVSTYDEGVLFIDVIDSSSNELAWRGSLSGVVKSHKDPNKAQAAIEKIVRKILQEFPPSPHGG